MAKRGRPPKRRGPPSKYKPEFAEQLPEMYAEGQSVAEVCKKLGVYKEAYYKWVKKHEEFGIAHARGMELCEAWWTGIGRAGALGKINVNPTMWIFNMKNRFGWRDKKETEISGSVQGVQIYLPKEKPSK